MRLREPRFPAPPQIGPRWLPKMRSVIVVVAPTKPPRARLQRASKRAAWAIILAVVAFLTVQLMCFVSRDYWHDRIFSNKLGLLTAHWHKQPFEQKVVVLGSSRVLFGLDAAMANETLHPHGMDLFNFGIAAAGPVTQNVYLRRLLDRGLRPDVVVVEILPAFLHAGDGLRPMESKWLRAFRLSSEECEQAAGFGLPITIPTWRTPLAQARVGLLAKGSPLFLTGEERIDGHEITDAAGFARTAMTHVTPEQYRKGVAGARRQYEPYLRDFVLGDPGCAALEDTIRLCQAHDIRVVLLRMPEGEAFREFYPPLVDQTINGYVQRLTSRYQVESIDGRDWVAESGFHDGHHLLTVGARVFTERFARELPAIVRNR